MYAYKVEIDPASKQKEKIHQGIGVCRFLYNTYIKHNEEVYKSDGKFVSHMEFAKHVNHHLKIDKPWIRTCHSKAWKKALANAESAFLKFFKGETKYPKLKKKGKQDVKIYLPKNNVKDFTIERHRAKVPFLGWVRLKEKGYIPEGIDISSCTISQKGDRYFISFLVKVENKINNSSLSKKGVGVDLGLKNFATISDGKLFGNINKGKKIRRLEVTLKRAQRSLARKLEANKKRKKEEKPLPHESGANIKKAILRIQNLHRRLTNIRWSYTHSVVNEVVKTKPLYITIEDLNVRGMMKNKHLSRVIAQQNFHRFKVWLEQACRKNHIELRMVDRFYPSSKLCSCCGTKKTTLSLSERLFICEHCGANMDRDYNASLNLENAQHYTVLVG